MRACLCQSRVKHRDRSSPESIVSLVGKGVNWGANLKSSTFYYSHKDFRLRRIESNYRDFECLGHENRFVKSNFSHYRVSKFCIYFTLNKEEIRSGLRRLFVGNRYFDKLKFAGPQLDCSFNSS